MQGAEYLRLPSLYDALRVARVCLVMCQACQGSVVEVTWTRIQAAERLGYLGWFI